MSSRIITRLERLDQLIRIKSTGTPFQLAMRLNISERTLYHILNEMRIHGAPIQYSRSRQTYYYERKGEFYIRFFEIDPVFH